MKSVLEEPKELLLRIRMVLSSVDPHWNIVTPVIFTISIDKKMHSDDYQLLFIKSIFGQ